jgi:hypothetical protein
MATLTSPHDTVRSAGAGLVELRAWPSAEVRTPAGGPARVVKLPQARVDERPSGQTPPSAGGVPECQRGPHRRRANAPDSELPEAPRCHRCRHSRRRQGPQQAETLALPLGVVAVGFLAFSLPPYLGLDPSQARLPAPEQFP